MRESHSFFERCLLFSESCFLSINKRVFRCEIGKQIEPQSLSQPILVFHRNIIYFLPKMRSLVVSPWGEFWAAHCPHLCGWRWEIGDERILLIMCIIFCFTPHPSWLWVDSELGVSPGRLALASTANGAHQLLKIHLCKSLEHISNMSVLNTRILTHTHTRTHTHTPPEYTDKHIPNPILGL